MKYIDADKFEDKLIEIEERHPAFCESVYDNAYYNCLNEVRLIISSLLKEQISPLKGKFTFPKFLYARTVDNKTIDVSYAPQSLDAIEYIRNDSLQHEQESIAERFARIIRGNLIGIDKEVQHKFEQLYFEITGNKMYGGYND